MDEIRMNGNDDPLQFDFGNDDPFAVPPPLGDLGPLVEDDPVNIGTEQNEDVNPQDNVAGDSPQESGGKKKKRVVKPRVNLNEERLCSKKGVEALKNLCADVKFKGKGHEVSDLNKLLHRFEHWAQCLMPRWPFSNVVEKCEILGTKSKVKNELKRVRRNEDEILRGEPEDEDENTAVEGEMTNEEEPLEAATQEDVLQEESPPSQLTEEQLKRIRRNRELAFERLEANKRRKLEESQTQSQLEEYTNDELPTNEENSSKQSTFANITIENVEPDVQEETKSDEILQDLTTNSNLNYTMDNINNETGFDSLSEIDGRIESQNNATEINNSFQLSNLNIEKEQVGVIDDILDKNNDILTETDMLDQNPANQNGSLPTDTSSGLDLNTSEYKVPHSHSHLNDATEETAPILENDRPKSGTQSSNNAADGINNSSIATLHADLPKDGCIKSSENLDGASTGQMDLDDPATE